MSDRLPASLSFASDTEWLALWGAILIGLALAALLMERRRHRRNRVARPDSVGWMPWTGLFLAFAIGGGGLLAVAVPKLMGGS